MKTYRALCFEDDFDTLPVDLDTIGQELSVQFVPARTFDEAQHLMKTQAFDLFVLDIEIQNERTTGIQLAEHIRQQPAYAATPILFTSMHTHYSHWLLSKIRHSAFLSKPFSPADLTHEIGVALELPAYLQQHYAQPPLLLPNANGTYLEVDPLSVSYIETSQRHLSIQYIDGRSVQLTHSNGLLKDLLTQINSLHITCLRQIYRSILINVNQIKTIRIEKNVGEVYLFHETRALPLGMGYRENIQEFL